MFGLSALLIYYNIFDRIVPVSDHCYNYTDFTSALQELFHQSVNKIGGLGLLFNFLFKDK